MTIYRQPQYDPNRLKEAAERDYRRALEKAKDTVLTIRIVGICSCISLCIYVASIAF